MVCVCILALVIRHANRVFSARILSYVTCFLCQMFLHFLVNGAIFGEKFIDPKIFVLSFLRALKPLSL